MYVAEMVEKIKISSELKKRIEEIIKSDDTYSIELQEYLQKIYKIEKETIQHLRTIEREMNERSIEARNREE
ncbi:MAG: hypothetical protein AB1798_15950 [Spirochaetota bacterium]